MNELGLIFKRKERQLMRSNENDEDSSEIITWVTRDGAAIKNYPKWFRTMGIRRSDNHCFVPCAVGGREQAAIMAARIDGESPFFPWTPRLYKHRLVD
jgi:hypothetical protein